jgi:O-antigen/teichoic acid export membrane protein
MPALKIFRNFAYLTTGRLVGDLIVFLFFIVLARTFGQEGLGQYSFAMALTSILVVFSDFGIFNLSVKDISRQDEASIAEYYGRLLSLRLMLVLSVLFLLAVALPFLPFTTELKLTILLIGTYQVVLTLVDGFSAVFIARESMHISGLLDCSLRVTAAVGGIAIILLGGSLLWAIATLPIVTLLHVSIAYALTVRRFGVRPARIGPARMRQLLHDALPFAQRSLLALLASRIALVFIGFMLGEAAAGVFNAAYRIIFVLLFVTNFAGLSLFPVASHLHATAREELKALYCNSLAITLLVGLPMGAGIWLIANDLIVLLYGEEFAPSAGVLIWLAWLIPVGFLRSIMEAFLMATDRQKTVTRCYFYVACLGMVLHTAFPWVLGVEGSAIAALIAEILLVAILSIELMPLVDFRQIMSRVALSLTGILAFVLIINWIEPGSLAITIPAAAMIYAAILLASPGFRRGEFRSFVRQIQGRTNPDLAR